MDFGRKNGLNGKSLERFSRCCGSLNTLFMSDIVTANGRNLQEALVMGTPKTPLDSKYTFPRECPTTNDWLLWKTFWANSSYDRLTLCRPVGGWIHRSHVKWKWFVDEETGHIIRERLSKGVAYYYPLPTVTSRTRNSKAFRKARTNPGTQSRW